MPNLAIADRVFITLVGKIQGQRTMTTWLYRVSAITGTISQDDAFTALHTKMTDATGVLYRFKECAPVSWGAMSVWYQVISPVRFRKTQKPYVGAGLFPSSEANMPFVIGSITRVGELAKRSEVGGIRIPIGTNEQSVEEGYLSAQQLDAMSDLCQAMRAPITTSGTVATFVPQVGMPAPGQVSADLKDAFPQPEARTMNRRVPGRGI